jgi:type II secretory ATPase GspE/PulE/Tfp pilus assembly ATPase PilB-like protein
MREVGITKQMLSKGKLYHGKGCTHCFNTGYLGRSGIYELLPVSGEIRRLIITRCDAQTIKDRAIKEGMVTLLEDGVSKALKGITTIEEVLRVSGSIL